MADAKTQTNTADCPASQWHRLPAVLVAHCLSFVGDVCSLVAVQSSCKAWRANDKLEPVWKALFLHDWEEYSASNALIATGGGNTPWQERYLARARVEASWKAGRCKTAIVEFEHVEAVELLSYVELLVCNINRSVVVLLNATDLKEVKRRDLLTPLQYSDCLAVHDCATPVIATAGDIGVIRVWSVPTLEPLGVEIKTGSATGSGRAWTLSVHDDLLATASVMFTAQLWNWRTGELLCSVVEDAAQSVSFDVSGRFLFARTLASTRILALHESQLTVVHELALRQLQLKPSRRRRTLLALNRLWGLGLPRARLHAIGLGLGADVPFFLCGTNAWVEGIGDIIRPLDLEHQLPGASFAVVKPAAGLDTKAIFSHSSLKRDSGCATIQGFAAMPYQFGGNDLQPVAQALCPEIDQAIDWLASKGLRGRMTGSGSAVFAQATHAVDLHDAPAAWQVKMCENLGLHPLSDWALDERIKG